MAPTYQLYCSVGKDQQQRKAKMPTGRWLSVLGLGDGDPTVEMRQRRRVDGYKAYAVEGKVKASIRRGLYWIKAKCMQHIASIHPS